MFFLLHFINSITIIIFNSYDEWLSIDLKYDKWYVLHEIILLVLHLEAFISYSSLYSHIRSKRKYGTVLKKSINNSPMCPFLDLPSGHWYIPCELLRRRPGCTEISP